MFPNTFKNTFPTDTVIIKSGTAYREFDLFIRYLTWITVLKYDDATKKLRDLDYYFWPFRPPCYIMSKKPKLVWVKIQSVLKLYPNGKVHINYHSASTMGIFSIIIYDFRLLTFMKYVEFFKNSTAVKVSSDEIFMFSTWFT